jgi:small conductance mechanosensitive channel
MLEENTHELMVNERALLPLIVSNALSLLGAIIILLIGLWLSGKAHLLVVRTLNRTPHFDEMLKGFFGSVTRYLVLTFTGLAVLSEFGIQTTSLIAVLGAAGLAVGLALQGTLSHLAAGVMLLIFRPFRIGHNVQVGGSSGTVKELSLFWTELVTDDKVQIIVPNASVWGQALRNFSIYLAPPYAGSLRFRIGEAIEPERAIEKVQAIVNAHPRVLRDPAPSVLFDHSTPENALEIAVSFSVAQDETAAVKSDLIKAVHTALSAGPREQGRVEQAPS